MLYLVNLLYLNGMSQITNLYFMTCKLF